MTDTIKSDNSAVIARLEKRLAECAELKHMVERELGGKAVSSAALVTALRQRDDLERERDFLASHLELMNATADLSSEATDFVINSLARRDARVASDALYLAADLACRAEPWTKIKDEADRLRREAEGGD